MDLAATAIHACYNVYIPFHAGLMTEKYTPELLQQLCENASKESDGHNLLDLAQRIIELLEQKRSAEKAGITLAQKKSA
jgi:hypothetical protein